MRLFRSILLIGLLGLAACGGDISATGILAGDSDPHPGVARAHRLPVQGIDVSRYQGDIDWSEVRDSGIRFAYLKTTEGGDHIDPRFQEYWNGAARAGVPRGAYHFMYWCRPVHEQALWFILNVPPDPNALPPVLDLEWNNHSRTCTRRVPPDEALQMAETMYNAMWVHTGKRPVIYTDINFHNDVLEGHFDETNFWLRSVAAEPDDRFEDRPWLYWQFTATGRVRGIDGNVDRNAFYGTVSQWEDYLEAVGVTAPGS